MPYVPAPRVRPNRYLDLSKENEALVADAPCTGGRTKQRGQAAGGVLLVIALGLPVKAVEHCRDCGVILLANIARQYVDARGVAQSVSGLGR